MLDVKLAMNHVLSMVWSGDCCSSDQAQCLCGWQGSPSDYTTHFMLVVAGVESEQILNWKSLFPGGDVEGYLDLYRPPNEVKARKAKITKQRNEDRKREKLIRMAANGDATAQEQLNVRS